MRASAASARAALVRRPGAPRATPVCRAARSAAATRPRGEARSRFRAGAAGGAGAAAEAARLLAGPAPLARPPSPLRWPRGLPARGVLLLDGRRTAAVGSAAASCARVPPRAARARCTWRSACAAPAPRRRASPARPRRLGWATRASRARAGRAATRAGRARGARPPAPRCLRSSALRPAVERASAPQRPHTPPAPPLAQPRHGLLSSPFPPSPCARRQCSCRAALATSPPYAKSGCGCSPRARRASVCVLVGQ